LPQSAGGPPLRLVTRREMTALGEVHQQVRMLGFGVELGQFRPTSARTPIICSLGSGCTALKYRCRCLATEPKWACGRRHGACRCVCPISRHEFEYNFSMQLRYNYRLDPQPRHRWALGKAFGCARVVFNDALAAREAETQSGPLPEAEPVIGIDLGLRHFAVLSHGRKITAPRLLRRAEKLLKLRQRDMSRKQQGSRNRDKARVKVARAHARVADARRDFHHQLSTSLIRDNQAVAVEDLAVKGLARTRMAKSVYDAGWSGFVGMLEYKARLYGREFHRIGRFEPTSQTCSACGVKDGPKPLHVREWQCRACGAHLDRDVNAAVNVAKAAGLAVTACRAQVRPELVPAQRVEAGTHPKSHPEAA
jgi:IS605 OrfB family transposase